MSAGDDQKKHEGDAANCSRAAGSAPEVGSSGWLAEVAYIWRKRCKSADNYGADCVHVDHVDLVAVLERCERLDNGLRRIEAMYAGICLRNADQYSAELMNEISATLRGPNVRAETRRTEDDKK